uniref:Amine oxidase domain-containing protein n=1 Tax=Romanomermis culicivorax TaxID=13658 RepID=A0A915JJE8_ROMCU
PKGYANLPIILAEGLNIECGAVVKEIKIQQDGCLVKFSNDSKRNFKTLKADAVLCTVPLGVLKKCIDPKETEEKSFINFCPPLPKSKVDAINRLGFGNLNKVVLCFDRVFWDPSRHMFGYINEKTEARGEFFLFWTIYNEPTVIALVAGKSSSKIEYLSEEIVVERCLHVLRTIFSQDQVPPPKETMVTRWANDPFSCGSYSFVAVGASGQDYDVLAQSLPETGSRPKLFFAGEHTCRRYPATVHGAVISALQQAGYIANELLESCL